MIIKQKSQKGDIRYKKRFIFFRRTLVSTRDSGSYIKIRFCEWVMVKQKCSVYYADGYMTPRHIATDWNDIEEISMDVYNNLVKSS